LKEKQPKEKPYRMNCASVLQAFEKNKKKKAKRKNRIGQCCFIALLGFNLGLTLNQPACFREEFWFVAIIHGKM
jgi:hypothetical protein